MISLPWQKLFFRVSVLIASLAFVVRCTTEEEPAFVNVTTQFAEPALTVAENQGEQSINISFDKPAAFDGEIIVKAIADNNTCYSTSPLAELGLVKIQVLKGDTKSSFKMVPTDNRNLDGDKTIKFTITSLSEGLITGLSRQMTVSVLDDESPAAAKFELPRNNIRESDPAGGQVVIGFDYAAPASGVIVAKFQSSSKYGVDFTTEPEAVGGKIFLQVSEGDTQASINIYPVNDQKFTADRNISLKIIDADGGVKVGGDEAVWWTITDDDGHQISTIESVRSMYSDSPVILQGDVYIEGVVTSIDNTWAGRVVVEDGTGALPIQFLSENKPVRGDVVLVNIGQKTLHESQGSLEVGQVEEYEKLGEDVIRVTRASLTDLLTSPRRYASRTVQLVGVTFTQADGVTTLGGDRVVTDGGHTILVRTGSGADFSDDIIPLGPVVVTGIFSRINNVLVVYPQESKDVRKLGVFLTRDDPYNWTF